MRTFYGILFKAETKDRLENIQKQLQHISKKGRFVIPNNFHMTLRFLGEIEAKSVAEYAALLDEVVMGQAAFTLYTAGIGAFNRGSKCMPWVGIEVSDTLLCLQKKLQAALNIQFGLPLEKFTPHITLARDVELHQPIDGLNIEALEIRIEKIALFESKNVNGKLVYEPRAVTLLT